MSSLASSNPHFRSPSLGRRIAGFVVGATTLMGCASAAMPDDEPTGIADDELTPASCVTVGISAAGSATTNAGISVARESFNGCAHRASDVFTTRASYPGTTACPNVAILEFVDPTGWGAEFSVNLVSPPRDKGTCEATHVTWRRFTQDATGAWSTSSPFWHDTKATWQLWPSDNAYHCTSGADSAGEFDMIANLASYKRVRFVAGAYRLSGTGTKTQQAVRITASNECIR